MPLPSSAIVIDIRQVPEVLAEIRREFSQLLIEAAQDEDPAVAARLFEIAALIEIGQRAD